MRRPLTIFDLMVATLVVAVHLFHFPLAARYRESNLMYLIPLVPTLIAIWIHIRTRPTLFLAILTHYVVCVSWAFLWGYGYAIAARSDPGSAYFEDPFEMGSYVAREMAVLALITTFLYGSVIWCFQWAQKQLWN